MSTLEFARFYLSRGLSVIPLQAHDKKPLISWKEYQERHATQEEITRWFSDGGNNIGIVTGKISGITVVDFDTDEAVQMATARGFFNTPVVRTGKGYHAYCAYRDGVRNFQKRDDLPGIDLRSDGGYVAAPPSTHESGTVYAWCQGRSLDEIPFAELPGWLHATKQEHKAPVTELFRGGAEEGNRNDALARLAGSAIAKGDSMEDALNLCMAWNTTRCKPPLSDQEVTTTVKSIFAAHIRNNGERAAQSYEWPHPPTPLPEGLPPVKALDSSLIPAPLRGWLMDIADRMQIPPDFSTAAAVVALGSIIGRGCGIHPKRHDDWLVVPNLWGGVIGRPSLMKTPAVTEAQRHLTRLESEARELHQAAAGNYAIEKEVLKSTKSAISDKMKQALKAGKGIDDFRRQLAVLKDSEPARRRYQTQDSTTEKLGELLNQNPRGLLVNRDELIGWFQALDKSGREGDRAFYLEAWNGTGAYTYDRIGRGTLDIDALCVSIFGAITPGPLSSYVYQTNRGGSGDDGLLQRFQVMVWPDTPATWKNVDRFPDTTEKNRAWEIFKALSGDIPGAVKHEDAKLPALRFSPEGQGVFDEWRGELETRTRGDHGLPTAMESHLTKYRSLMPSLALIFHLVEVVDGTTAPGPVSERAALMAVGWCCYLESHAGRIYGGALMPGMEAAREIIKHIKLGAIQEGCKPKDIYRNHWARLATPEEVKAGLDVLTEYEWLTVEKSATGGRPSDIIRLNPLLKR